LVISLFIAYSQLFAPFANELTNQPLFAGPAGGSYFSTITYVQAHATRPASLQILCVCEEKDDDEERKKPEYPGGFSALITETRHYISLVLDILPAGDKLSVPALPRSSYLLFRVFRL
jgi:hypothetical protein